MTVSSVTCTNSDRVCDTIRTIRSCQSLLLHVQQATKKFLYIASGIDRRQNHDGLLSIISAFDKILVDLHSGNPAGNIIAPPSLEVTSEIEGVQRAWATYKSLLEVNISSVGPTSRSVVEQVEVSNQGLLAKTELLVQMYVGFAQFSGIELPPADEEYSRRQLVHLGRMANALLLANLQVKRPFYIEQLATTSHLFEEAHESLVHGNVMTGIPELSEICTLHEMLKVGSSYGDFALYIVQADLGQPLSQTLLLKLNDAEERLHRAMENVYRFFKLDDIACNPVADIDNVGWANVLTESGRQRMLTQKAFCIYLQVAQNASLQHGSTELEITLNEAATSLRKCMKGSHSENIPAPPTQNISDRLAYVWQKWQLFDEMRFSVTVSDFNSDVPAFSSLSTLILDEMNVVADLYVDLSLATNSSLGSVVWEISQRARLLLQKMSKEALLVSFGENAEGNAAEFAVSVRMFEALHRALLMGQWASASTAVVSSSHPPDNTLAIDLYKERALPRTTDVCTLAIMANVFEGFQALRGLLYRIIDGQLSSAQLVTVIEEMDSICSSTSKAMTLAVGFYKEGQSTCSNELSETQWETIIENIGRIPYLFEMLVTNYYLLSSGLTQTWMDRAAVALEAHIGHISTEAASPVLLEAFLSFQTAWNSYRPTMEERALGLRVAYITLNPHPAGSKDALDVAPGPEAYHAVHQQYHPIYRSILYERNYYDIFMFDLDGNLIYSVYKELDYATNFAANGTGKWKDSGLGDAFRAAMGNPDVVTIIDWRPYGPSHGALASFLSTGIRTQDGSLIGVFCTQMPPESKPIDSHQILVETAGNLRDLLTSLAHGSHVDQIAPPPTQNVADLLFAVSDSWETISPLFMQNKSFSELVAQRSPFLHASSTLLRSVVDGAWIGAPSLQGTKILIASGQLARVQSMCAGVISIGIGASNVSRGDIEASMTFFEQNHTLLIEGNKTLRASQDAARNNETSAHRKTDVTPTVDFAIIGLMDGVMSSWLALKPTMQGIVAGGETSEPILRNVVEGTNALSSHMQAAFASYASSTRTTTLMPIEILTPLPLTGDWSGGRTMRLAALLAEDLINQEQVILPGYALRHVFFDDQCRPEVNSQIVLAEMSRKSTYLALGGAGCSKVCSEIAFAASTLELPFLSYECSATYLSDVEAFPDLTRLGTTIKATADVVREIGIAESWTEVTVISGDPARYKDRSEDMQRQFQERGLKSSYMSAYDSDWSSILSMMQEMKGKSQGKYRILFVIGTETYFRKVVCASLVARLAGGVTWLSEGTWRHEWWKNSALPQSLHEQWLIEDASGSRLKEMVMEFLSAWESYAATDSERREYLQTLYITEAKEQLDFAVGDEDYHRVHRTWHPIYRGVLRDRRYYDIFVFDLRGNLIYSVYKESDYASNFAADGSGQWKESGLGDAFRLAMQNPDNVSYVDWMPYGPSAGALAAFFSTGVRNADGELIGVYSIQLPEEFERSIEELQPECTLEAISSSFEGAINIAGLGKPTDEDMEKPLPCFDEHSARSFHTLIDEHLANGYPLGETSTQVKDPYNDIKAHAVDATCIFAFTVRHLLDQGYTIKEILQKPSPEMHAKFKHYVKTQINFQGVSGTVRFSGNDKPNNLAVQQVQQGSNVQVGLVFINGSISWINGGPRNESWAKEPVDPSTFFFLPFHIVIVTVLMLGPIIAGLIAEARSRRGVGKAQDQIKVGSSMRARAHADDSSAAIATPDSSTMAGPRAAGLV